MDQSTARIGLTDAIRTSLCAIAGVHALASIPELFFGSERGRDRHRSAPGMPLVPEKLRARQEVRAALGSQFWGQEAASPRSIDGKTVLNPCEPVPLGLMAPSGLSRTQQLLAAQALGILALPSYLGDRGGLVGLGVGCSFESMRTKLPSPHAWVVWAQPQAPVAGCVRRAWLSLA